ncbi:IS110 family transposase [Aquimarina sp. U1-2]|uniref:transposase n=1 Tax=Aquimarina sp. U1-2 TaxID=2823141 RepID=UPI001AECE617|nr:transposase [Aquimarina sp. U1-2]MBP2830694.1 IS110 family transposase [Aquimarina sp. U1-2]
MLIKEEKAHYKSIETSIKRIETEMQKLINQDANLKESYKKITRVIGVGPVIAIKCIVETENFIKFNNARKFSCHCGLAPFPYQSGSSIKGKTKTHFLRDKSLKATLTKGAISAIQHDPQIKAYYKRKIAEGKHHMSVKNAVANKLVLRIFAVALRREPFVKLAA